MDKPYNSEIIKLMAEHSDLAVAYASAMKWDWLRRQRVGDINGDDIGQNCAFCIRILEYSCKKCPLAQKGNCCYIDNSLFKKARNAHGFKDQQAFTENANNLYFQILSIIDDLYKPKEKPKEMFYHTGQRFKRDGVNDEFILAHIYDDKVCLLSLAGDGNRWREPICVGDPAQITESEFKSLWGSGIFTLIDKK